MRWAQITDSLWVGAFPASPDDIDRLRAEGVTAVLCLQTDEDHRALGVRWDWIWRYCVACGLVVARVPIPDFDPDALRAALPQAVEALDTLLRRGHGVYLHCSAGLQRSPTVAVAWLMRHGGMNREEAVALLAERRGYRPFDDILDAWEAETP